MCKIFGRCVEASDDDYGDDFSGDEIVCFRSIDWRSYHGDWKTLKVQSFKGRKYWRRMEA
jgi:hypothetical protein